MIAAKWVDWLHFDPMIRQRCRMKIPVEHHAKVKELCAAYSARPFGGGQREKAALWAFINDVVPAARYCKRLCLDPDRMLLSRSEFVDRLTESGIG